MHVVKGWERDSPSAFNSLLDFGNILQREEYGKEISHYITLEGAFAKPALSSRFAAIMDVAMSEGICVWRRVDVAADNCSAYQNHAARNLGDLGFWDQPFFSDSERATSGTYTAGVPGRLVKQSIRPYPRLFPPSFFS